MRWVISCGLILCTVAGFAAPVDREAVRQEFRQVFPAARFLTESGQVTRIYGAPFSTGPSAAESAAAFVARYAAVLGADPQDLIPGNGFNDVLTQPVMFDPQTGGFEFTLVYYRQQRDGVPVYRSELRLLHRNDAEYPLVLAASSLRDLADYRVEDSQLPALDLTQIAPAMTTFSDAQLVIWAGLPDQPAKPTLAVWFIADNYDDPAADLPERWEYVADAASGAILHRENLIIFTDITGSVQGMATEGPKADYCANEVPTGLPHARIQVTGGNTAYADADGNFTIPHGGTTQVTVTSPMAGLYFAVDNIAGGEETLSVVVTPPGPANFMHNAANTSEQVRAQTNGYLQANVVRDFCLTYNATYPTISTQTSFPVRVNRSDGYCPGNAWYDGSSINFCLAAGGYPNTAWSNIIHHEYGHHMVASGGSGQGAYGEGMSDCVGILIADDPVCGYGFEGNCNTGIRTGDNNFQYPCSGEIHYCGQLLSGCIWSARNELFNAGYPDYLEILSNLTVNSILLHDGDQITPTITVDFLTLDDNDGNIGNGTPHYTQLCNAFNAHNMDCPPLQIGLGVSPTTNFVSNGPVGGPFSPISQVYVLENMGPAGPISYTVSCAAGWVTLDNTSGTLQNVGDSVNVTVTINDNALAFPEGDYFANVQFVNETNHVGDTTRQVTVRVGINDVCEQAKVACPGFTYTGSTVGMNVDGSTTCGTANASPDAWYKYTPASDGSATFSMCTGTSYDAVMSIHSGCPGTTANTLACDDDGCGGYGAPSLITMNVTAGNTYLIRISGWSGASGTYGLTITGPECGVEAPLDLSLPNGLPLLMAPLTPIDLTLRIRNGTENYVPGSARIWYRYAGGAYTSAALTPLGNELYRATLPAAGCSAHPEFYFSAEGDGGSTVRYPAEAPTEVFGLPVGTLALFLDEPFEVDHGWTVGDIGDNATTGIWERAVPQVTIAQPGADHTPAGTRCFVTGALSGGSDGAYDVDGGKTTFKSPLFDLTEARGAVVSYWRWYDNVHGGGPNADIFVIGISSDGGDTWTTAETVGPGGPEAGGGWYYHQFNVMEFIPLTNQVRLRFVASDFDTPSLVEACVDDFQIQTVTCEQTITPGDMNCDGAINALDINPFVVAMTDAERYALEHPECEILNADCNDDGAINALDINPFVRLITGGR